MTQTPDPEPPAHDRIPRRNLIVACITVAAVIVMSGTTIWTNERVSDASDRTDDIARRADQRARCVVDVLTDLLLAVNERTTYTEALADANITQLKSFAALVEASLQQPPPDEAESRQIVTDYGNALDAYLDIADKAKQQRQDNPYPTVAQIKACR